ncbi:efflux transporter outer membrane subunit [Paraburkholderia sp. MM5384-R2]|uniref:efflux transporter outer membrane subunit n=1 Tax=Paraburkholderia sp. MM5384-R2 TaxID=2723097 RepID=UPI001617FD02|nr:efflux transporter outer membrane subunit [Paraburkholderia sp. MM5384-R2]MBB5500914.1 NodT family efflux transporter outer membrane factor (OMF) lipoprotein [Paraburkholderia sp. MM5384-R2]
MTSNPGFARHPRAACCRSAACAALSAATLLGGCEVGPDFAPPGPPQVSGYTREPLPERTVASDVHGGEAQRFVQALDIPGQWWTLFHSAALNALVERALEANPSLQAAQATLREANEALYAAQGALFPTVSADISTAREKISGSPFGISTTVPVFRLNNASVSVTYLLDIWGGTRRQIESLAAQAEYERFELEASYLSLTSNVATAAVQEASLRAQIAATEEIVDIETQQLAGLKRQFAIGAVANAAVLAQAATLAQTRAQLPPLQKQLALTRNQLTAYLGRFPSDELVETFDLASLQLPDTLPVSLPSTLVEQRPDIRASKAQLHAASAEIGVATANMLPQLTLSAAYGSETNDALFSPGSAIWNLGAGLTQPLFEGGTLLHRRRAAIDAFDAAAAQYRNTVISAFQNVADALRALQSDADAVVAEAAAERAAADSLAVSQREFHVGAISYLALLDAQRTYQQARISLVQTQATRYSDTVALFQAVGGGWWNRSDVVRERG